MLQALALILPETAFIWIAYIGLEPFIRRRWPDTIVSWNRLPAGRPKDPLVGRSVLIGVTLSVGLDLFVRALSLLREWLGPPPENLHFPFPDVLLGGRLGLAGALNSFIGGVFNPLAELLLLLLLRLLLRKLWLAIGAIVLLPPVLMLASGAPWEALWVLASLSVTVLVLVRFGLLAATAYWFSGNVYGAYLATLDFSVWYAARLWMPVAVILAISAYAFHVARAGRPLFGKALAD